MERRELARRLIVNADDFGRSQSINQAVIRAHGEGILTSASLMVNEAACDEAVALAREHPKLGVGLHLALVCGHSALQPDEIPGLVNERREFSDHPVRTGLRYFARGHLRGQLRSEIRAQFERFCATGLPLDHVDSHLHLHLHPTLFPLVLECLHEFGARALRLTRDPFWLNRRLAAGRWGYRASHSLIYHLLSSRARPHLRRLRLRHTGAVFGLLQNARVDEAYICRLLPALPPGDSELYSHPSLDQFKEEFDALVSPRVKSLVHGHGIQLIRYQDL